jgi:indoleamine 2,3-dioxygenase
MLPKIPVPADYGLSETNGFLPEDPPLSRLPDPYYNKWEDIIANLQALILCRRIRAVVDRLPIYSTVGLEREAEWRRAYSLLCFIAHAYIWGGDEPSGRLPKSISVPLQEVARHLQVPPVATYAALCLWNYKPIFDDEGIDTLENLATLNTFTGSLDESWFYLVSVAIEARGAHTVPLMLDTIRAAQNHDSTTVTRCLHSFAESMSELTAILQRMHENCDPFIFYDRIRPFLAGSKNMAEVGLPFGVFYEESDGSGEYRKYSGGSNAQSSLIQFFDIILGIEHRPTGYNKDAEVPGATPRPGESKSRPDTHNFLQEMRRYMPASHARFLVDVAAVANIKQFVLSRPHDTALSLAYDACLAMLTTFRDKHIAIVARYIVMPARKVRDMWQSPTATRRRMNLATSTRQNTEPSEDAHKDRCFRGTGGTSLIPFLKQARDETAEPAVHEWTKKIMTRQYKVGASEFAGMHSSENEVKVSGLASTWTVDVDIGGICNW